MTGRIPAALAAAVLIMLGAGPADAEPTPTPSPTATPSATKPQIPASLKGLLTVDPARTDPNTGGPILVERKLPCPDDPTKADPERWATQTEVFSVAGRGPVRCGRGAAGRTGFDQESVSR